MSEDGYRGSFGISIDLAVIIMISAHFSAQGPCINAQASHIKDKWGLLLSFQIWTQVETSIKRACSCLSRFLASEGLGPAK